MDLQVELGMTFLVVTHDQDEAMTMADRIAMMDKGRLIQVGTPPEIYETPANREVASFVGEITLFQGTVAAVKGNTVEVESTGARALLSVETQRACAVGDRVTLGVRPEKMRLHQDDPEGGANVLAGEVWDIGYLGDWTTYRIRLASGAIVRVSRANAERHVAAPRVVGRPGVAELRALRRRAADELSE